MKPIIIPQTTAILTPSVECTPVLQTRDYEDFRLSDVLQYHNVKALVIEPIEHQCWNPELATSELEIKYAIIPTGINSNISTEEMPYRFTIEPLCKIGRQCSKENTTLLQRFMADDLILRYFKDAKHPVWVCSEINHNMINIENII